MITTLEVNNIKEISTEILKSELAKSLTITAKHLQYLASIWQELEYRGEDLSSLKSGLALYLPLIANNQLDADLVVKYAGQKMLLYAMSKLPISEQKKLAAQGTVKIIKIRQDGSGFYESNVSMHQLASAELNLVFSENGLRTSAEQILILSKQTQRKPNKKIRTARRISVQDDFVIVGASKVETTKLLDILSEHFKCDFKSLVQTSH